MSRSRKLLSAVSVVALSLTIGAGAAITVPAAQAASTADGVPTTDARHPDNVKVALHILDQINTEVRGKQRTALTEEQIATANSVATNQIQPGTGTGDVLPAYKVNSDIMAWAQTRANELAALGKGINHVNMWNGSPDWAHYIQNGDTVSNILKSPKVQWRQEGSYRYSYIQFGPENLHMACGSGLPVLNFGAFNPAYSWYSELQTAAQGYGHYLAEISQLGTVAGVGVAQSGNCWYTAFEIAYVGVGTDGVTYGGGTTQTVAEARAALDQANVITSVAAPTGVTVASGTNPKSKFPTQVTATYGDGHTGPVDVTWAEPNEADYTSLTGGTFTVHGTITGYDKGVDITYTVTKATVKEVVAPQAVTITQGMSLTGKLPGTVTVKWSNGKQTSEPATWDTSGVKTDVVGTYTATATVQGRTVSVTVEVVAATITSVTAPAGVSVAAGTAESALGLPGSVKAAWSNGTSSDVAVSWPALTAEQKNVLASREGGSFTLHGTVADYASGVDITVTVKPATVIAATLPAGKETVTTPSGIAPTLPENALVTWSNGEENVPTTINWPTLSADKYSMREGGTFTLTGTVAGTDKTVTVTVKVEPATVQSVTVDPASVQVVQGASLEGKLPSTATVTWSNGDTEHPAVEWDTSGVKTDVVGTYTATTTVQGQTVSVTVKVVAATITSVTAPAGVSVAAGTAESALGLPGSVKAAWSNGTSSDVAVSWPALTAEQKAVLASREGGSFTLTGTVAGYASGVDITVTVKPATVTNVMVATDPVETESGVFPALPKQATVTWSNGDTVLTDITWTVDKALYSTREASTFTAQGTVAGQAVSVVVNVKAATPVAPVTAEVGVTVTVGESLSLPQTLKVTWSNGDVTDEPVEWDEVPADKLAAPGTFDVEGTIHVGGKAPVAGTDTAASGGRLALRAAAVDTAVTFPVTAHVTVVAEDANTGENPVVDQPASGDTPSNGTDTATKGSDTATKGSGTATKASGTATKGSGTKSPVKAASLARTGATVAVVPVSIGCIVAGAAMLLVRRRRDF